MVLSQIDPVLWLKLTLLAGSYIKVSEGLLKRCETENLTFRRKHYPWVVGKLTVKNPAACCEVLY